MLLLLQDVLDQIGNACLRTVRACGKIKRLRSELLGAQRTEERDPIWRRVAAMIALAQIETGRVA